jgi:murein DD-endopeptidase MepM/ murein hydrolase activator NlpD
MESIFKFTHWPTEHYANITQAFGVNPNYYSQFGPKSNPLKGHEGIDMRAPTGSRIMSVAPGLISDVNATGLADNGKPHNYGIFVRVDHAQGYQTTYAHLREAAVNVGQVVVGGQLLGFADNTGNIRSGASHLHLTLKKFPKGDPLWPYNIVDPTPFVNDLIRRGPEPYPRQAFPVAVIGKLKDVRPYVGQPGYLTFADRQDWTLAANFAWIDSIRSRGYPFLLVTDPAAASGIYRLEIRHLTALGVALDRAPDTTPLKPKDKIGPV